MTISAIITTYNRANYIERALDSVLAQTLPANEIIVVDDGSTDETGTLVKKYDNVRYICQSNKGISAARNQGIAESTSDWIAFLDVDDEWQTDKLHRQREALVKNPEFRICHTEEIWVRRGRRVNPKSKHRKNGGFIFNDCLPLCVISPSSVIIKRDVFEDYGLFDTDLPVCEDYDLWLRICAFLPVLYISEPLIIKYGGHADQLSKKYWGIDRFRIQALEKIIGLPGLSEVYRQATIRMILDKIGIYLQGAEKRGKEKDIVKYHTKKKHYSRLLEV